MPLTEVIVAALAVTRLSELIVIDAGPYGVFDSLRRSLGRKAASNGSYASTWSTLAELVHCKYCTGFWIAVLLMLLPQKLRQAIIIPMAIAGGQSVLSQIIGGTE